MKKRIYDFESLGKVVDCVSGTSNLDRHSIQKKYGTQIWSTLNHSKKEQEQERKCLSISFLKCLIGGTLREFFFSLRAK
jgi:hypothetical protein